MYAFYSYKFTSCIFQTLQLEQNELSGQVDEVRDSAIDLMNNGDRYHKMVEPELTQLNRRWEDVSTNFKVHF
jgi:dystrophin